MRGFGVDGRMVVAVVVVFAIALVSNGVAAGNRSRSGVTVGPRTRPIVKRRVLRGMAGADHSALARASHRVVRWQRRLERPQAQAQRRESRTAFHGIPLPAARKLLVRDYGEVLEGASVNPAAAVESEGKIIRYLNDYSAEVHTPEGMRVMSSSVPLRVPGGPNAKRPVDLDLTRHGADFTPVAPLKQVTIGDRAGDGVVLSSPGVALTMLGANSPGSLVEGQGVFFGEVDRDIDAVAAPKLDGVDLSAVLRSGLSPEQLRYRVAMPLGSSLRKEDGGAVIQRGDSIVARIPAPSAQDAQGTAVPVSMRVHGDELVVEVSHRESSYAYPILVDPEVLVEISETSEGWEFYAESSDPYYCEGLSGGGISFVGCESSGPIEHSGPGGGAPVTASIADTPVPFGERQYNPYQEREEEVELNRFKGEQWWWPHNDGITSVEFIGISASGLSGPDVYTYFNLKACGQFHEWEAPETTDISVRITPTPEFGCNNWDMWIREPIGVTVNSGTTLRWERENPPWGDLVPAEQTEVGGTISVDAVLITRNLGLQEEEELNPEKFGNGNPGEMSNTDCMSGDPVNCATGNLVETQQDVSVGGRGPGLGMTRTYNSQLAATEEDPGPFGYGWSGSYGDWIDLRERCIANCNGEVSLAAREGGEEEGGGGEEPGGGPVAAYSFDENEGEVAEDSAGSHDGSISGAEWTPGKFGPALRFNGKDPDMVTVPSASELELTEAFTIEAWVRPNKSEQYSPILTKETSSFFGYALEAGGPSAGVPAGFISPEGNVEELVSATEALPNHAWSDVAFTFDGEDMCLYVDGALAGTAAAPAPQGGAGSLQIGATELFNAGFTGKIDEVRIYDQALDLEEIQADEAVPIGTTEGSEEPEEGEEDPEAEIIEKTAVVHQDNGSTAEFHRVGSGSWTPINPLIRSTLASQEGDLIYTLPNQSRFRFSGAGLLKAEEDRNGNAVTIYRDGQQRVESVSDESGRELAFSYDPEGFVESIEDPIGNAVDYEYEEGNLVSVSQLGEPSMRWQFGYDVIHELDSVTDGRGKVTTTRYSALKATRQKDPLGRETHWEYEATENGSVTTINEPNDSKTVEEFNEDGLLTSVTKAAGTGLAATTTLEYDEEDELTAVTDPDERTTEFGYDSEGNKTSEIDPAENERQWAYDGHHETETETDPGGETTTIVRDAHGNPETVSRPAPGSGTQTTSYVYDGHGQVESMTDPLQRTWEYGYDEAGNRVSQTDPAGDRTKWGYDEDSRPVSVTTPRGNVEGAEPAEYTTDMELDPQGRPLLVTDPLGHSREYVYDGDGNLTSTTDANSHSTTYVYDAAGQLTETLEPGGAALKSEYDDAGQLVSQADGNEKTTGYVRNALEEQVETIDPLGRVTTAEYDPAGQLTAVTDPAERVTSYSYEPAGRLQSVGYSDESTPGAEFTYNANGSLTQMSDGSGESSFEYDQLGRLVRSESGHGDVVAYEYDLANETAEIAYPNGHSITRSFDEAGRLEAVEDWLGNETAFLYDADSMLARTTFPAGTDEVDLFSYDRMDRMGGVELTKGGADLGSVAYTRDPGGQVEEELAEGLPGPAGVSYSYDEEDHLIAAGPDSFEYDDAGNPIAMPGGSLTYDEASQLETGIGVGYAYDELGNRVEADPVSGSPTLYGYDQANRLTSVERAEAGESAAIDEQLEYDGLGQLMSRTVSGTTKHLTWDNAVDPVALLDDGQNSYIYGPNGEPIEQVSGSEVPTFYHHDQLGSTRMLTDAAGEVTATFTYGPYGALEGSTGTQHTPLGFAGQYTDSETGLQYLRARYYDPTTGQFLSRDPAIKMSGSAYGYTAGNPVNATDPNGLLSVSGVLGTVGDLLEPLNPIKYYEEEIEAWENGCSYLDSVLHGLEGAGVAATDVLGLDALVAGIAATAGREAAISVADSLAGLEAGNDPNIFLVSSDAELQAIWDSFVPAGTPIRWQNYDGEAIRLSDGTEIGLRQTSSSGGRTIDINQPGKTPIKIHIK